MRSALGKYPLFDHTFHSAEERVRKAMGSPMDVPIPKDAGGYTHERHKRNYVEMQLAGILYAIRKENAYAMFVREMLLKYADLYPSLGNHPAAAGESAGRLFWQTLNETVWLVHATQAYDCIYNRLSEADRTKIEEGLIRPMAKFLSEDHVGELDRIHNHGTWTCAAVGMAGYVLRDRDLVEKALYGSKKDTTGGFIRQLELLFSPDGYYTEGAYYVRYALLPFFTFAQVIENNQPNLRVFEFRNRILQKAFLSAMQLTYTNGAFIPINDALKEMTYLSPEIVVALNTTYARYGRDSSLLGIAAQQKSVVLGVAGVLVARDLAPLKALPEFPYKSVEYTDGPKGDEGGIGLLRSGPINDQSLLVMKYTGHGLSHGHFDKLGILYYDQGREILQDYGAARFVNVEPKYGGRYLPETKSWAMQSIAHNTVTVDGKSHYGGNRSVSETHHADRHFFSATDPGFQIVSAKAFDVSPGVSMQRTIGMIDDVRLTKPILLDVFRIESNETHTYDLPYYYFGHLIHTNVVYTSFAKQISALGSANGYQHLWKEAEGRAPGPIQVSWMTGGRYYTLTSSPDTATTATFVRIGAGDPNFNLRHDPGFILRRRASSHVFASVLEPHGRWNGTYEYSENAAPMIESVRVLLSNHEATAVEVKGKQSLSWIILISNGRASESDEHTVVVEGKAFTWKGNARLIKQER